MTEPELQIRLAHGGDLQAVLELYQHLNPSEQPLDNEQALQNTWSAILNQPGMSCIVALHRGAMVASCCLAIIPNLTRGGRSYALIENVVTHSGFRRRGWGRAVVSKALHSAWAAGCYKVMLLSGSKRPEVHRFYESCGFRSDDKTGFVARPG